MKRLLALLLPAVIGGLFLWGSGGVPPAHATTVIDGGGATLDAGCSSLTPNNIVVLQDNVEYKNWVLKNAYDANIVIEGHTDVTFTNVSIYNWNCTNLPDHDHAGIVCRYCKHLTVRSSFFQAPANYGDAIYVLSDNGNPSGGKNAIINNNISGGWDGIGGDDEKVAHGSFDTNTMISGNHVLGCWDDGIQVEGGDTTVIVEYNTISGCGAGIAFAAPLTGPLSVQYNLIQYIQTGKLDSYYCFKVGNPTTALTYLRNNDCQADDTTYVRNGTGADAISQTNIGLGPIISRNNNFKTSRYAIEESEVTRPAGESYDYDCLTSTSGDPHYYFVFWANTSYYNLSSFTTATGQEAHGVTICPTIALYAPPACADYNGDGKVSTADMTDYFNPISRYDAANYDLHWDRNLDGVIDNTDLSTNWHTGPCP